MEMNKYDLNWCVRRLPYAVRSLLKKKSIIVVAGGYIRACILNEPINDVDLFVGSKEYAKRIALEMVDDDEKRLIITDNAITIKGMKYPVQFITRWVYDNPSAILNSFDFTICQAAFWWDASECRWRSVVSDTFYQDLAAKRLIYTDPVREEEPGGSMLRVLKYYQKGYRITLDAYASVITRLVGGVEFDERTIYPDGSVAPDQFQKIIKGLLHEVDPNVDPDHIIEDIKADQEDPE